MKRATLFFLFLLYCSSLFSQDLMGKWTGLAPQNINGVFYIEVNITKLQGNIYSGTASSTAVKGPFSGGMKVNVSMEKLANGMVSYKETVIIDSTKQTNYYWCPKIATLKLVVEADSMEMSGNWTTLAATCPPGTMKLKKEVKRPPPPPKVVEVQPKPAPVIVANEPTEIPKVQASNVRIRGTHLTVEIWDFDAIDADSVSLTLNGKQVGPKEIGLPAYKRYGSPEFTYPMELVKGDNTFEIVAKNEGLKPNNTVGLIITDKVSSQKFFFTLKAKESSVIHFLRM